MEKKEGKGTVLKDPKALAAALETEKKDLDSNRMKLDALFTSPAWNDIDPEHAGLLNKQAQAMQLYSDALGARMEWLRKQEPAKPEAEAETSKSKAHKKEEA